jgi:uncharacterized membrane protein
MVKSVFSRKMFTILVILGLVIFFGISIINMRSDYESERNRIYHEYYEGVVISKEIEAYNHNLRTTQILGIHDSVVRRIVLPFDTNVVYRYIEIGDTLKKSYRDSMLVVHGRGKTLRVNLILPALADLP